MQNKFTEVANKITTIKTGFAEAITAKGVETLPSASFGDMITNIGNITGGGTVEPEQPIEEWVKPHDWPDIEAEPLEPNEIRVLFCDVINQEQGFYFTNVSGSNITCTIDWGDGSPVEEFNSVKSSGVRHKYEKGTGTPCDRGYTTFVAKIKNLSKAYSFYLYWPDGIEEVCSDILWFYGDLGEISVLESCFGRNYAGVKLRSPLLERVNITKTDKCKTFLNCFKNASSLVSVELPFNNSVTNFSSMFSGCYSLGSIPLINTSKGTDFYSMFNGCYSLGSIPPINTSLGTNFSSMFNGCCSLESIPPINTSKGTDFSNMFFGCYSLGSIPLIDTSLGTSFSSMFFDCRGLKTIPPLDFSKGTNFDSIFKMCYALNELPPLNLSSGTNFNNMFEGCKSLEAIPEITGRLHTKVNGIFSDCYTIKKTPPIDTVGTSGSYVNYEHFKNCYDLMEIGEIKLSSNIKLEIGSIYGDKTPLLKIDLAYDAETPPVFTETVPIKLNYTQLNADDLNKLMTQLPDGNGKTLDLKYNPGSATCDPSIATAKNWTVLI